MLNWQTKQDNSSAADRSLLYFLGSWPLSGKTIQKYFLFCSPLSRHNPSRITSHLLSVGQATLLLSTCCSSGVGREGRERKKNKEEQRALTPIPTHSLLFFFWSHLFALSPTIWTPRTGNVGVHMKHELYLLEGFLIIAANITTTEMNVSGIIYFWHLL